MQKFYIVGKDSPIYQNHVDAQISQETMIRAYNQFAKDMGIESTRFHASKKDLAIVPTQADRAKFCTQFRKLEDGETGLVYFRKNSPVGKEWVQFVSTLNLVWKYQLHSVFFLVNFSGHAKERRFMTRDGELYLALEANSDFADPKDCTPIKGSEFYRKLEEEEALDASEEGEYQNDMD